MIRKEPPGWVEKLIDRWLKPELVNGFWGDLLEEYFENLQAYSPLKARRILIVGALGYFRFPFLLHFEKLKNKSMSSIWSNYFLAASRNLTRNKQNSMLCVIGLVASFITFMAISQYVYFEMNYDNFHSNGDRLYRLTHTMTDNTGTNDQATTFYAVKDYLADIPEIEKSSRTFQVNRGLLKRDNKTHKIDEILFTDPSFLELFDFDLLQGNRDDLARQDVIFLSQGLAARLFKNQEVMGQTLEVQDIFGQTWSVAVAGVYSDIPENSHLAAEALLPITKLEHFTREGDIFGNGITLDLVRWRWMSFPTYVLLQPETANAKVEDILNEIVATNRKPFNERLNQEHTVRLQLVASIHTTAGVQSEIKPANDENVLWLLLAVAAGVILIGWINYVNLGAARSISRGKEVGIRKVLGSTRGQLKVQFQVESFLISLIALLLAIAALIPLGPILENIVQVQFFTERLLSTEVYMISLMVTLLGSVIAGYYPSQILSGYKITEVIKGKLSYSRKGIFTRRLLVTLQFVFSLLLLSTLMVVQDQMDFMLNSNLGVDIERKILLDGPTNAVGNPDYSSRMNVLKNELKGISGVQRVSVSSMVPGILNGWRNSTENTNEGGAGIFTHRSIIDEDYLEVYDMELLAGRPLSRDHGMERTNILVNEYLSRRLGHSTPEEALEQEVIFADARWKIVGVVKDFYQRGVQVAIEPMTFNLDTALFGNYITLEVMSNDLATVNRKIASVYERHFPDAPFHSRFLDAVFQDQYQQEQRFRSLLSIFTTIAVVIACLGVLGLAAYIMNQRMKEISIRKVLGARISTLFLILNQEYLIIGGIAFTLAIPITYYLASNWLEAYANRITITPWYFLAPVFTVILAILVTTLHYTMKIIRVNPAETLKDEG